MKPTGDKEGFKRKEGCALNLQGLLPGGGIDKKELFGAPGFEDTNL